MSRLNALVHRDGLSRSEVEAALKPLGFRESSRVGGEWYWFEAPWSARFGPASYAATVVVQFYEPASDFSARIKIPTLMHGHRIWGDAPEPERAGHVEFDEDVVEIVGPLLRRRFEWAARVMVSVDDPRLAPYRLLADALTKVPTGKPEEEWAVIGVLVDQMLDDGVDF